MTPQTSPATFWFNRDLCFWVPEVPMTQSSPTTPSWFDQFEPSTFCQAKRVFRVLYMYEPNPDEDHMDYVRLAFLVRVIDSMSRAGLSVVEKEDKPT